MAEPVYHLCYEPDPDHGYAECLALYDDEAKDTFASWATTRPFEQSRRPDGSIEKWFMSAGAWADLHYCATNGRKRFVYGAAAKQP